MIAFLRKNIGLLLIAFGALMLAVLHLTGVTFINALLGSALFLMFLGTFLHVRRIKKESRY